MVTRQVEPDPAADVEFDNVIAFADENANTGRQGAVPVVNKKNEIHGAPSVPVVVPTPRLCVIVVAVDASAIATSATTMLPVWAVVGAVVVPATAAGNRYVTVPAVV